MDVDIDLRTDFDPLEYFADAVKASRIQDAEIKPHPAGIYFQNIAKDKITNLSAIPYQDAEEMGYFKIDFLHLSILDNFESKDEIRGLLKKEPDWCLLQSPSVVSKLFQLHKHYDIVRQVRPESVQDLADCIALIRPAKRYLLDYYLKDKIATRKALYQKPKDDRPYFKKPHAVSYALTIVLQLHLISAGIL
jgi:DNA polymerase III alpha subunit